MLQAIAFLTEQASAFGWFFYNQQACADTSPQLQQYPSQLECG
jgi:hypothetical protein